MNTTERNILCEILGLKPTTIAEALGESRVQVSQVLNGERRNQRLRGRIIRLAQERLAERMFADGDTETVAEPSSVKRSSSKARRPSRARPNL